MFSIIDCGGVNILKNYCIVNFIINRKNHYCIWYTNAKDGFILEDKRVRVFHTTDSLEIYCLKKNISLENELSLYDIDNISNIDMSNSMNLDCEIVLNFWNIIQDLSYSTNEKFLGNLEDYNEIYNKLFYGNNLPAMGLSEKYLPIWEEGERRIISEILHQGIKLLDKYVVDI